MPAILGRCHLITGRGGGWLTRRKAGGRLVVTRGFGGSRDGFKQHCRVLLIPAEEMRMAIRMPSYHTSRGVFLGC